MKHRKKHGDNYCRDEGWLLEAEPDEPGYVWLSQVREPWQKRWLNDNESGRRFRDNEDWDQDRMEERRRARTSSRRERQARRQLGFSDQD